MSRRGVVLVALCLLMLVLAQMAHGYPSFRKRSSRAVPREVFLNKMFRSIRAGGMLPKERSRVTRVHEEGHEEEDHHDEEEDHHDEEEEGHDGHGHEEGEPHPEDPVHYMLSLYDVDDDDLLDRVEFEEMFDGIIGHHDDDHHDDEHGDDHEEEDHHEEDHEGEEEHHEDEEHADEGTTTPVAKRNVLHTREFVETCPEPTDIFNERDVNMDGFLDESELAVVSADFLVMIGNGCAVDVHEDEECEAPSTSEKWGYGFLAVFVVSIISIIGISLIPVRDTKMKGHIVYGLIAFAVGTLFGDAILHLLPIVWGIHGHSDEEESGGHNEEEEEKELQLILWKGVVVFAGLLAFLILETWIHHASHVVNRNYIKKQQSMSDIELQSTASDASTKNLQSSSEDEFDHEYYDKSIIPPKPVESWREIKPVGWLNLSSDLMHNLVDGLAIGAAFSVSLSTGLATTIAVALHEIPQEFADFGILLHAGFSKGWAIFFNFVCSLSAFLGLVIGLAIGESVEEASIWILALTAGGFIYISLVDMMPVILEKPKWRRLTAAAFFINMGFWIMFILGWYEDDLGGCGGH